MKLKPGTAYSMAHGVCKGLNAHSTITFYRIIKILQLWDWVSIIQLLAHKIH